MSNFFYKLEKISTGHLDFQTYFLMRLILSFTLMNRFLNEIPYLRHHDFKVAIAFAVLLIALICFSLGFFHRVSALYIGAFVLSSFLPYPPFFEFQPVQFYFMQILAFSTLAFAFIHGEKITLFDLLNHQNSKSVSGVGIRFIQLLVLIAYASAFLNKMNQPYLSGFHIQQMFMKTFWGSYAIHWSGAEIFFKLVAWISALTELILVVGLSLKKFRQSALILAIGLHIFLYFVLPIYSFSLLMIGLVLSFWKIKRNIQLV